ncbi:MAG: DNA methyltransferase [Nitrospirota bacterium]
MDITKYVQNFIPEADSPEKIYELFRGLGYQKDKILDPSYKRKIEEFEFAKEEKEKVKDIYTVFNYDGKLQIFLIVVKNLSIPFVRYLTKRFSDKYLRFLLLLTSDYKEYTFVFPEFERVEEGKHKLKLTKLIFDREHPYHTDLLTITNIALTGDEENWRDIWKRWKDAFSVEKVTDEFFEDYTDAFFELRRTFEKQKIPVKNAHELSQQFLNRLMFLYFIARKRWLNDAPKFIKWYWERYKEEKRKGDAKDNTFYENWLRILFLEAFNNKYSHPPYHSQDIKKILAVTPYLNGGLFQRNELDELPFHINDSLFEKVLNFFEKYNFTIREDLPLDVEVAVDPQMIGYVYESLSNVAEEIYERQDLGIFYTPTIEVDFMCRRSLAEYLSNHLSSPLSRGDRGVFPPLEKSPPDIPPLAKGGEGGFELSKEWIYRLLFDEDKKDVEDYITKKNLWYRLEEVLDNLTVVDPACGSGAFLVGMLRVLVELYRLTYRHIQREMTEFELKKKIIGNSLYGVDVMPWATHSAELRLWLQLIIEEDIPYEQRKLFPLLPNLNLRLRVGDSLVQEVGGVSLHIRDSRLSPSLKRKLLALKTEKEKYYNNDPTAKFKSDKSLLQEEIRIFGEILDDRIVTLQKEIQSLETLKRQEQTEMFGDISKIPPLAKGVRGDLACPSRLSPLCHVQKWGGKYLRAPDIFFTILEKGKGKLVRLGDIAEVRRGITSGANEFFLP